MLAFNTLVTRAERDEHVGYRLMALGMNQALRNVFTHDPQRDELEAPEALEWLGFISAMHRMLDRANQVPDSLKADTA